MNDSQGALDFADGDRRNANPTRWEASALVSPPLFHGTTYNAEHDEVRLSRQMQGVFDCMKDGRWRTLAEIHAIVRVGSEASISAGLWDFRKTEWGRTPSTAGGAVKLRSAFTSTSSLLIRLSDSSQCLEVNQ